MSATQLLRFSAVGVVGFVVDALTLHACVNLLGASLYGGRLVSYFAAATTTWALNRRYTFSLHQSADKSAELGRFIGANAVGGVVNYATYAIVVAAWDVVRTYPVIGVAAGSAAGLGVNFYLSRRLVFRGESVGS